MSAVAPGTRAVDFDVLVIGAGAAGVCAAVEGASAGRRTMVLEAFPEPGGAAATSGGGCLIAGTPLQERLGIRDSPDLAFRDWLAWGGDVADRAWARMYLERGVADLYLWLEGLGVVWEHVTQHEGNSAPRWHHPEGGGQGLMARVVAAAERLPIQWCRATAAKRLLVDQGRVIGAETVAAGCTATVTARATVLATGGLCGNLALLQELLPDPGPGSRYLCGGALQAQGDGYAMARAAGAHLVDLERIWVYAFGTPDYRDATGNRGIVIRGIDSEIWVNAQGQRFHNEQLRGGARGTAALMAQKPRTSWTVFDRAQADVIRLDDPQYRQRGMPLRERVEEFLAHSPYVHQSESLAGLAHKAGLPAEAFVRTVERWNDWLRSGLDHDPDFGRPLAKQRPIAQPPFFAAQYFPLPRKNFGGVRTDLGARALRPDGTVLPGLYAAGEVAGMAGGNINGAGGLGGTMIGPSLFSGRVAGATAAADLDT